MSTRSHIGISEKAKGINPDVLLYKHSDGYPSGNLPLIFKFIVRFFKKYEGKEEIKTPHVGDSSYFAAWFMYYLMNDYVEFAKKMNVKFKGDKLMEKSYPKDGLGMSGYGICKPKDFHWDIEWYYHINKDRVNVYKWEDPQRLVGSYSFINILDAAKGKFTFPDGLSDHMKKVFGGKDDSYVLDNVLGFIDKKYDPFYVFDHNSDEENIVMGYEMIKYLTMDINDLPLHVNDNNRIVKEMVAWRLLTKTTTPQKLI